MDASAENLSYMGITEAARGRDSQYYSSGSVKAVVIRDRGGVTQTADGRPRIFLNASAFDGDPGDYLRHEMIHVGGAAGRENPFGSDLYYLGYTTRQKWGGGGKWSYTEWVKTGLTEDEILGACR